MFIDDLPMYGYVGEVRKATTCLLLLFGSYPVMSEREAGGMRK